MAKRTQAKAEADGEKKSTSYTGVCPAGGITADTIALRQNLINKE